MNLDPLLAAYNWIATRHTLPELQPAQLSITSRDLDDPDEVWRQLSAFAPDCGWLCQQSRISTIQPGQPLPQPDADSGVLLSAECYHRASDRSLHLRQNGNGGWRLSEYHPGEGTPCLSEELQLIAHQGANDQQPAPRRLRYRRYWAAGDHGICQLAACFIGFDTPGASA